MLNLAQLPNNVVVNIDRFLNAEVSGITLYLSPYVLHDEGRNKRMACIRHINVSFTANFDGLKKPVDLGSTNFRLDNEEPVDLEEHPVWESLDEKLQEKIHKRCKYLRSFYKANAAAATPTVPVIGSPQSTIASPEVVAAVAAAVGEPAKDPKAEKYEEWLSGTAFDRIEVEFKDLEDFAEKGKDHGLTEEDIDSVSSSLQFLVMSLLGCNPEPTENYAEEVEVSQPSEADDQPFQAAS